MIPIALAILAWWLYARRNTPSPAPAPSPAPDAPKAAPRGSKGQGKPSPVAALPPSEPGDGGTSPRPVDGLLLAAVREHRTDPVVWVEVPWPEAGVAVRVGAHVLRVDGVPLPASWRDTLAIQRALGWVAPTRELSDRIWSAAPLQIPPQSQPVAGMASLGAAVKHGKALDAAIERVVGNDASTASDVLTADEGKDWILSPRLLNRAEGGGDPAVNYGWHVKGGSVVQPIGPDEAPTKHASNHVDYSQTLRPIQRKARKLDGSGDVDLLDVYASRGLPARVVALVRKEAEA